MESPPRITIVIWATDARLAEALCAELADPLRELRVLEDDGELAASGSSGALLVAEAWPRLQMPTRWCATLRRLAWRWIGSLPTGGPPNRWPAHAVRRDVARGADADSM